MKSQSVGFGNWQMYPRYAQDRAHLILEDTPILGIVGPRQSGKTTLARSIGGERSYITLDNEAMRNGALNDPVGMIRDLDSAVIDEVQRAPNLMLAIKEAVDSDRRPGRFIVTGSTNITTLARMQDSLAGRIETLTLLPLSQDEMAATGQAHYLDRLFAGDSFVEAERDRELIQRVLTGGYPEAVARKSVSRREDWFAAYAKAIAERDLPDIANVERAADLPRFLEMLGVLNGQLLNAADLGSRLKIDRKTALRYLTLVEQIFVIRSLPAWSGNALKRLIKAPKLHFVDSGLAASLASVTASSLDRDKGPFGPLLECFVLSELYKQNGWSSGRYRFSHFRDIDRVEVDIVVQDRSGRIAGIEVKAAATVGPRDFAGLSRLEAAVGDQYVGGIVLYDGERSISFGDKLRAVPVSALWSTAGHQTQANRNV